MNYDVRARTRGNTQTHACTRANGHGPQSKPRATGRVFVRQCGREIVRGRHRSGPEGCTTDDGMSSGYGWVRFPSPVVPPYRDNGILMEIRTPPFRIPARDTTTTTPGSGQRKKHYSSLATDDREGPWWSWRVHVRRHFRSTPSQWRRSFLIRLHRFVSQKNTPFFLFNTFVYSRYNTQHHVIVEKKNILHKDIDNLDFDSARTVHGR